jgi:hypothetical protein
MSANRLTQFNIRESIAEAAPQFFLQEWQRKVQVTCLGFV